jgi:hypothetical protein
MLDLRVTLDNGKVVIEGLRSLAQGVPGAITRALTTSAKGIYRFAFQYLSGPGGASKKVRTDYTGFTKASGEKVSFRSYRGAGGYPVPVRSGYLRKMLDWLKPGEAKSAGGLAFAAAGNEAVIYDSAEYANAIHEGRGSSRQYGKRPFMTNALERFNQGGKIRNTLLEEIEKAKGK